jgi:hypothetical protein
MNVIKSALIAAAFVAAGAASAAEVDVYTGNVDQHQQGYRNDQKMEVGVIDLTKGGNHSYVEARTGNIYQSQRGSYNKQSMEVGKIDAKGSHDVYVTTGNINQTQAGQYNKQEMKIGVISQK